MSTDGLQTWAAFPVTLSATSRVLDHKTGIDTVLAALWRISSLETAPWAPVLTPNIYDAVLEALTNMGPSSTPISSIIPMVKTNLLDTLAARNWLRAIEEWPLNRRLLRTETSYAIPPEFLEGAIGHFNDRHSRTSYTALLQDRVIETRLALLAEFLDDCNSGFVHYK
ncbi:hypothetical protein B0H17DRAFT_1209732 [Mycena rosella]|uniref:Uncharacterized protein n=1 Tax=Mycena rosella TaxID=1033263 RepID=A0AAD7CY72_MYCRO|nr:hypothetical protein B0H17DRAFT_1209732 [Mycena rosella]